MGKITEYRGVRNLVYAIITQDDAGGYTTGAVKPLAGVAEISKTSNSSSEPHYYDNYGAVIVVGKGADDLTISTSAIPFDVLSDLTGQYYDSLTGMYVEGKINPPYVAIGYETDKTDGSTVYVWRLKCRCAVPDQTSSTQNDGTDANGQELNVMSIETEHTFMKNGDNASSVNVDGGLDLADVANFFATVQTPDTIQPKTAITYTVTNTLTNCTNANTQATVASGAAYSGVLTADDGYTLGAITVTMGNVDISSAVVSGSAISIQRVTGNVVITCTATA